MRHVTGEVIEFLAEAKKLNLAGMKDEGSDVCWMFWTFIYNSTGADFPALGIGPSWKKYQSRLLSWNQIFSSQGLEFHPKYLANGGNYQKPEKVEMALSLARKEQRRGF